MSPFIKLTSYTSFCYFATFILQYILDFTRWVVSIVAVDINSGGDDRYGGMAIIMVVMLKVIIIMTIVVIGEGYC